MWKWGQFNWEFDDIYGNSSIIFEYTLIVFVSWYVIEIQFIGPDNFLLMNLSSIKLSEIVVISDAIPPFISIAISFSSFP